MELNGDFTFDAPQEMVWEAVLDPQVLGSVMPGGQGFEEVGDHEYAGKMKVKVGPVQGTFTAKIKLSDVNPPESYVINVDGKGTPGFVKANGDMKLTGQGEQTYMAYGGTANIGGRIASVGQRLMDSTARSIIKQSLEALNEYLKVQVAQQQAEEAVAETPVASNGTVDSTEAPAKPTTPPTPVPTYTPPSQMELMMNVARDVMDDFVPKPLQPVLIGVVVLVLLFILSRLFVE